MCYGEPECKKAQEARKIIREALDGHGIADVDKRNIENDLIERLKKLDEKDK